MATKEENKRYRDKLKRNPKSVSRNTYWPRRRLENLIRAGIVIPEIEEDI